MAIEIFSLIKERCKLSHLNVRGELHGEETVPAIDLKFEFDSANNLLSKLHPDLRAAFYRQDDNRDLVGGDHLPTLKFPLLDPTIGWNIEVPRTLLRVHSDDGDLVLAGGKTNNFKLTIKEGGTVNWKFRVQFSDPSKDVLAALSGLLQQIVPITLECRGEDDEKPDLFQQVEQQTQAPMSEARQKAETMFAQGTPPDDPDFQEVKEQTLTVEQVRAADNGDVVDATFTPPADDLDQAPTTASNVEPISKRRGGRKAAGGNLE